MHWRLLVALLAIALALLTTLSSAAPPNPRPRENWSFKFRDFVIGAWWGPGPTEPEMKLYRECGFNLVMSGRYMQLDGYGDADKGLSELDLAHKYGLGVMFDTYTMNDKPWGGTAGPYEPHPLHHPASLIELQWLHRKLGSHPALVGYMVGDDQGEIGSRSDSCTRFLYSLPGPKLMPWLCGWISPQNLAQHNNPFANPQIYPTLYQWSLPADALARLYALSYASWGRQCRDLGIVFWPMFNVSGDMDKREADMGGCLPSDSLTRFPAYAALAYGAEGIWYFCYGGGSLSHVGPYTTDEAARAGLTPLWPVAKEINHRIAAWGPRVLGCRWEGGFGTAFGTRATDWPFPEESVGAVSPEGLVWPAPGKLVRFMSRDLLAGVLTHPGRNPLLMVVDCRASKGFGDLPAREVRLRFDDHVKAIRVLEGARAPRVSGRQVCIALKAGEGQMLELEGDGLDALCASSAIYGPPIAQAVVSPRRLSAADLSSAVEARLRLEVFGADAGEQYQARYLELNGQRVAQVPSRPGDSWGPVVIKLTRRQLASLRLHNQLVVRTECGDAWKFRAPTLAVRLADGAWVRSSTDPRVHSVANWAYSEGQLWGTDGLAGPIALDFD